MPKDPMHIAFGDQKVLKFIEYEYDRNGQILEKQTRYQKAAEHVSDFATADPAGANDIQLAEIDVGAGEILEIYNVICSSETGAKGFAIAHSTAAFAAPYSGVAGYTLLWAALITGSQVVADKDKTPFLVIDNSGGSVTLHVNLYGINAFMDVNQANTEDLSAFMSGYKYTP